ncbi:ATP-binding protein [Photobacterium rosenbergii]|uniref:histidine kinase n=1 Tax=Photobacterium rosenbergii TaxID=294936 RepID=A0ABU3ZFK0_9GAMM|nr:ATP-binding protein [Photobacterium rosenbergii]MDV5168866.1 ATP-binding protein [Photobacterium rosenbergii]
MEEHQGLQTQSIRRLLITGAIGILSLLLAFFITDHVIHDKYTQLQSLQHKIIEASNSMLMMRRHEKDYLARVDSKYLSKMEDAYSQLKSELIAINQDLDKHKITTSYVGQQAIADVDSYFQQFTAMSHTVLDIFGDKGSISLIDQLKDTALTFEQNLIGSNAPEIDTLTLTTKDLMYQFFTDFDSQLLPEIDNNLTEIQQSLEATTDLRFSTTSFNDFRKAFYVLQRTYKTFGYSHNDGMHGAIRSTIHSLEGTLNALFTETPKQIALTMRQYEHYKTMVALALCITIVLVLLYVIRQTNRLEQDLINAREHEKQANKAKSAFLANMSHEIRTPLNGILGMTEILSDSKLSAVQKDYLSTINASSQTLLMLINDILDLSKIESGHLEIAPHTCALKEVVFDTAALIAPKAQQKGIGLVVDLDTSLPDYIKADEQKVRQVLMNLASNAIKFTDSGSITFTAKQINQSPTHTEVFFSVKDTGIGIDNDKQAHIFEEFKQETSHTSSQYGGTGLGLAISAKIVEMMGGKIQLDSQKHVGSTFSFTLSFQHDEQTIEQVSSLPVIYLAVEHSDLLVSEVLRLGYQLTRCHTVDDVLTANKPNAIILIDKPCLLPEANSALASFSIVYVRQNDEVVNDTASNIVALVTAPLFGLRLNNMLKTAFVTQNHDSEIAANPTSKVNNTPEPPASPKHAILIVEDNKVNQQVVCINLKRIGFDYLIANNGQEAVSLYQQHHSDIGLILMDCMMPVMSGFEATQSIRDWEQAQGLKKSHIIALTASILDDDIQQCFDCGMDDYLPKPFKRDVLIEKLKKKVDMSTPPALITD